MKKNLKLNLSPLAGNDAESGVVQEPLLTVGSERVIQLVPEGGSVFGYANVLGRNVHTLS